MTLLFLIIAALVIYYFLIYKEDSTNRFNVGPGKRCPNCKNPVEPNFNVCPVCKETLRKKCGNCGEMIDTAWMYCPYCERSLDKRAAK